MRAVALQELCCISGCSSEQCVAIAVAISDLLSAAAGGCGELNFICVH